MALTTINDRGLKTPINLLDNEKIRFGTGNYLDVYTDGTNSYINHGGTGDLYVQTNGSGDNLQLWALNDIYLKPQGGENGININGNGAVEIYHDNSKKFETRSGGLGVFGHIEAGDDDKLMLGDSNDLQIYHDGTNSIIKNTYEDLYINCESDDLYLKAADNIFMQPQAGETGINIHGNGAVGLYYDNSRKLATTNTGVKITDNFLGVNVDSASGTFGDRNAHLAMGDTDTGVAQNGDGQLELWANNQEIVNVDTGSVSIYKDLRPHANNNNDLGSSSNRWRTVFSNNSLNTSDKNLKNTIVDSDLGLSFINKLRPVSYKWKKIEGENPDDKTHYGLIAQEIETALASEGKTLDNFAGVYKPDDYKEDGTGGAMAIAVSELISPLIKAVQELSAEVEKLKNA